MLQPKIISLKTLPNHKLHLYYETGEERVFDVSPYICGDWYSQLKNADYFNTVHILPDGTGIQWQDGQDIAPHELYESGNY